MWAQATRAHALDFADQAERRGAGKGIEESELMSPGEAHRHFVTAQDWETNDYTEEDEPLPTYEGLVDATQ